MKTLQTTSLLAAVLLASACHHKRPATHERVASIDAETREGAKQMEADIERDTKEAGEGANKAGDDLDAALEGKHDVVGSAADDANAAANTAAADAATEAKKGTAEAKAAADKAATEAKKEYDADAKTVTTAADKAADEAEAAAKDAKDTAAAAMDKAAEKADETAKKIEAKKVSAEIESIDRHAQQITFRIRDEDKEISLQAGREMKVEFSELPGLTGMKADEAISKMHEGQDVDLKVIGKGEDAKVIKLDLGDF